MLVVPRGEDFCVDARLRRVCLLDSPPGPFSFDERLRLEPNFDLLQLMRMVEYLYRVYPLGHAARGAGRRPDRRPPGRQPVPAAGGRVVGAPARPLVVEAIVASPHSTPGDSKRGSVNYKHFLELWLDTLRDEYEQEASRSPLERGVLLGENRRLGTCFGSTRTGKVDGQLSSDASVSPLVRVPIDLGDIDIGGVQESFDTR